MSVEPLIKHLKNDPGEVRFEEVMETIAAHYDYTPIRFTNGEGESRVVNEAGQNEGSCKIFAFGQLNGLSETETLACFGQHYRKVATDPQGTDHANIRTFMASGWPGIQFDGTALVPRPSA